MSIVLVIFGAIALFVNLIAIIVALLFFILLYRDLSSAHTLIKLNTGRLIGLEKVMISIYTILTREMALSSQSPGWDPTRIEQRGGKFITEDGQHEADTFEELISKISQDPRYRVPREEDIDSLRQIFEEYAEDEEEHIDEDDEWKNSNDEQNDGPSD